MTTIDPETLKKFVESEFTSTALPSLKDFIKIENKSPAYDPDWQKDKLLNKAAAHLKNYADKLSGIDDLTAIVSSDEDKSPLLLIKVESNIQDPTTILFYGHYDKQPGGDNWAEGLGPYTPVEKDGYLYGRGSADDGYSLYAILTMIKSLQNFKIDHPKFVIMIEGSEESGSIDLPAYLEEFKGYIGTPNMIITMDSGAGDYERIWLTQSLRGSTNFDLSIKTLTKGVHSGKYSGIAPESFMILRQLLSRLENYDEEYIKMKDFEVDISESVKSKAVETMKIIGDKFMNGFPLLKGVKLLSDDPVKLYLNNTWGPSMSVLGIKGIPAIKDAGNVLRPFTTVKIGIRTPPTFDAIGKSRDIIMNTFTKDPPFNSTIVVDNFDFSNGVEVKDPSDKFKNELVNVSKNYLNSEPASFSLGVSVPFVNIFSQYFKDSIFLVTGAAGLDSNPHGPNERLNLEYTKKFICTFTHLIANYKNYV